MFRLKKLEIQGFKSFVERTSLTLPSRITAIVGPNGSGKSNICDAVQWVLGEQSARNLRGSTMEDVIFNGSARRKPLGIAEVALTLETRAANQWTESGGEVMITRRVTRDGSSDYFLNGKRSRLKDIQDVLLGTGLGVRAYSIIEQQRIDLILSSKPQDRRRLIEEAAGISKYKIRKRQAELKLEETRANLLRLTDVVNEIERTCSSLKRQAARAARWKEQADALAAAKRKLLRLKFDRLQTAVVEAEQQLAALLEKESAASSAAQSLDAAFESRRHEAAEAEKSRRELANALAAARERMLAAQAAVSRSARQAEEALARKEILEGQQQQALADREQAETEAAEASQTLSEVEAQLATAEARVQETAQLLTRAAQTENDLSTRRESLRRDLLTASSKSAEAANRERQAVVLAERLSFGLAKLAERKTRAAEALAQREDALRAATETAETARERLEETRARLEETTIARKQADENVKRLKSERESTIQKFHALDRKVAALETVLKERELGGQGARAALKAAKVAAPGVLADFLEAEEGFEKALDAALGASLEAPVIGDRDSLSAALGAIRSGKMGLARFVFPLPKAESHPPVSGPGVLGVSSSLLRAKAGAERFQASVPDAIVVESLDDALALAPNHPHRAIATRDGICVRGAVIEAGGHELPDEGLFTVRRDLRDLTREREALTEKAEALAEEIDSLTERVVELSAAVEEVNAASRRAEREHSEAETRLKSANAERQRASQESAVLNHEEEAIQAELQKASRDRSDALALVAERSGQMAAIEERLTGLEKEIEETRGARLAAAEADAAARSERDLLKERRRSISEALQTHRSRSQAAARRLAEAGASATRLETLREESLSQTVAAKEELELATEEAARAEETKKAADARAEELERELESADAQLHAARTALDEVRKERFEEGLSLERRRGDRDHVVETCQTDFGCLPAELPLPVSEGEEPLNESALSEEVAQRSAAIEKIGPVNHAALEEYDEESKRLHELQTQKMDLEVSLEQILETIKTINDTSSERFQEAFNSINANFSEVFKELFRGGSALMQLLDENDLLESGIEIIAQPPGKRNQSISLLSGGEKALTAIALLVAIFKYKPSPFCILDEVDAPLDEANIDRFTALLSELAEETQFVLITHSKRTMETAQALYGVTQEEPGVSKIVSVRFD